MPSSCAAFGCKNRQTKDTQKRNITFHRFPKNEHLRQSWARAMGRKDWQPTDCSRLCSVHFLEDDYKHNSQLVRNLQDDVVPSQFEAFPPRRHQKRGARKRKAPWRASEPPPPPAKRAVPKVEIAERVDYEQVRISEAHRHSIRLDHNYAHPGDINELRLRYEQFKDALLAQQAKMKSELVIKNKRIRQLNRNVASLSSDIPRVWVKQEPIEYEEPDPKLEQENSFVGKLMRQSFRTKEYDHDVLEFAQTIRSYSPQAYEFMRGRLNLPGRSTLDNHIRNNTLAKNVKTEVEDEDHDVKPTFSSETDCGKPKKTAKKTKTKIKVKTKQRKGGKSGQKRMLKGSGKSQTKVSKE